MTSQKALQQAVVDHLQSIDDHMEAVSGQMAMKPEAMDMPKKSGAPMKMDKGTDNQK